MLIISVGGFHPAFREIPPDLRDMTRMTIALLSGDNPRLTVQTYFAVTSNTVQYGARVELYAEACGFNIYGFLGYDLLVQFNPFHFIADISRRARAARRQRRHRRHFAARRALGARAVERQRRGIARKSCSSRSRSHFNVTWGDDAAPIRWRSRTSPR